MFKDGGDIGAVESPIVLGLGSRPPTVEFVVWIRLAVSRQNAVRISLIWGPSGPGPGRQAHRRTEDSILAIMAAMMPSQTRLSK